MKLEVSHYAKNALRQNLHFLKVQGASLEVRRKIRDKIKSKFDLLKRQPQIGQFEEQLTFLGMNHRRVVVGNYKIIYLVFENKIVITDIFDSRQDPDKMKS